MSTGSSSPVNDASRPMDTRQLLAGLRDTLAAAKIPQQRLDDVVRLIARGFEADVCSLYLLRAG